MQPIPIAFHLGPLDIRAYGIGMAVTFLFSLWYTRRRFVSRGLPWQWAARAFLWIVVASLTGARLFHVLANLGYYGQHPTDVLAVWKGGLSSFGGLAGGVPTGLWFQRRHLPQVSLLATLDIMAPVLAAAWIVDALFGRQLMVHAGGHPTTAWYGLYYAGEVGRRVPVPLFQAAECTAVWALLIRTERRAVPGSGLIFCLYVGLWGMARFNDEFWWLASPRLWDAVEVAGLVMAVCGLGTAAVLARRRVDGLANSAYGQDAHVRDVTVTVNPYLQPVALSDYVVRVVTHDLPGDRVVAEIGDKAFDGGHSIGDTEKLVGFSHGGATRSDRHEH